MQVVLKKGRFLFLIGMLFVISNSCDKIQDSQIPNVPVSLQIDMIIVNDLMVPGNSVFFPRHGFGGVIVYCEMPDVYYAYDAACTYEINQSCTVKNTGVLGECSCCGSSFLFTGGAFPAKGPAAAPLRQYNVSRVSTTMIRVYN